MSRRISNNYAILKGSPKLVIPPSDLNPSGTYLLSYGELTPDVDPTDLQESNKRQAKVQLIYLRAAQKLAKERGLSDEEANKKFFAQTIKVKTENGYDEVSKEAEESILDWITDDEAADLLTINSESAKNIDRVVTLFTKHRILYAVQITERAGTKARSVKVTAPWFIIGNQDWLSLDGVHFQAATAYDPETGEIGVNGLPRAVEPGDTLYLMKHDRSGYEVGDDSWNEQMTASLASTDKAAVYRFYLLESGRLTEDPTKEEETDSTPLETESLSLNPGLEVPRSTGEGSTTESTVTEATQPSNSEPTTTEVAPVA